MVNIPKITRELAGKIERDKALQEYRRKISDRQVHVFIASIEGFKARLYLGIQAQRGKKIRISKAQDDKVHEYVSSYIEELYKLFSKGQSATGKFKYSFIGGTPRDFKVQITGDGNIAEHLKDLRESAGLRRVSNKVTQIFQGTKQVGNKILFDISHLEGSTIAEQYATQILAKYETAGFIPRDKDAYEKLSVAINYDPRQNTRVGKVFVEDTFWFLNQSTTDEAYITKLLKRVVGDFLQDQTGFVQGKVEYIQRDIVRVAKRRGAKIKGPAVVEPKGGKASLSKVIKHKRKSTPTFSIEQLNKKITVLGTNDVRNWSLMLPRINALLHDAVKANMKPPRLVYRTGTFARSVEVTKVETTKEGYPVFTANYDRNPYQVFDRVLGAAPWNTPSRDPKSLIDKSVRDVMRNLAVGRFFVKTPVL